ncbi:acyl-CoA dehydrogenase family protein, partial [Amycolatopsis sp. NPDC000740]
MNPYTLTERLERELGDPRDSDRTFSYARCAEFDCTERFPDEICALLDGLGLAAFYVPTAFGGQLRDHTDLLQVIRALARRDFTVALAHCKTFLGSVCAWTTASPAQARALADRVLGGEVVSLALTERDHGSDLLAGDVSAVEVDGGYCLNGEKWLINNATRAGTVCVLARTDPAGGARGFSLLLVDKRGLSADSFRCLPKNYTLGVRAADISGIGFDDASVPSDALVGDVGGGVEAVLKSLQLTRTLCGGMSLGIGDHSLRLAADFAARHEMYGRRLSDLPQAARTLAQAYADLLVCEAFTLVATRAIHSLTAEQSVISAAVKYFVPTTMDHVITRLAGVLGARSLLTTAYAHGAFEKLRRDHRIVGIFDGSSAVNLASLVNQFPAFVRGYRRGRIDTDGLVRATGGPLDELRPQALSLMSRNGSSLVQGIPAGTDELLALDAPAALASLAVRLREFADDLHDRLAAV